MTTTADTIYITIPAGPVPYSRTATVTNPTTGKRVRVLPARYRAWRTTARDAIAILRRGRTITGPVHVDVVVGPDSTVCRFTPVPDLRPKGIRGDLDNYAKAVLDAAQAGGVIGDDRQVVSLTARFATELPPKEGTR